MPRPIELSRDEAEFIVEACERDGAAQWFPLQDELRRRWGMPPRVQVRCKCGWREMQGPDPLNWWVVEEGFKHSHAYCGPYDPNA